MNTKKLGKLFIIIGYLSLISLLLVIFYKLEYRLAFEDVSILKLDFGQFAKYYWINYLVYFSILIILIGWLLQYDQRYKKEIKVMKSIFINRIWNYKKDFFINLLFFLIFFIEVVLSVMLVHLIVFWIHAKESINIPYFILILLSAILINFIDRKLRGKV